jgi:ankyrin repeat protein
MNDRILWKRFENATTEMEIDQLILDGFNVNEEDSWQITPLICACEKGQLEVVKALIKHGAEPYNEEFFENPVDVAAKHGHFQIIEYLSSIGCEIANPIFDAICSGKNNTLKFLLSLEKDIETVPVFYEYEFTALGMACSVGNGEAFDLLLNAGALVNPKNSKHPLVVVAECLEDRIARSYAFFLILNGAFLDCKDDKTERTPLYIACLGDKVELVKLFTDFLSVNTVHKMDAFETPLILACSRNNATIVKLLLNARQGGADKQYVDRFGKQAIDYTESEEIRNLLAV